MVLFIVTSREMLINCTKLWIGHVPVNLILHCFYILSFSVLSLCSKYLRYDVCDLLTS